MQKEKREKVIVISNNQDRHDILRGVAVFASSLINMFYIDFQC